MNHCPVRPLLLLQQITKEIQPLPSSCVRHALDWGIKPCCLQVPAHYWPVTRCRCSPEQFGSPMLRLRFIGLWLKSATHKKNGRICKDVEEQHYKNGVWKDMVDEKVERHFTSTMYNNNMCRKCGNSCYLFSEHYKTPRKRTDKVENRYLYITILYL